MYKKIERKSYIMSRLNINKSRTETKLGNVLYNHIINNKREYFIVSILFFIGLIIGILFINNINDTKIEEINTYLNNIVDNVKTYEKIDYGILLKKSVFSNFTTIVILWFGASTIVRNTSCIWFNFNKRIFNRLYNQ